MGKGLKEDSAALKGIAILLMVFHHCYRTADKFKGFDIIFTPFTQNQVIQVGLIAKICVGIFAFVSGFGLMYGYMANQEKENRISTAGWAKRHLLSTGAGYWFIAVLAYIFYGVMKGFRYARWGKTVSERVFGILADSVGLSGIFGTKSVNGAWWYMGAAMAFILLVPFLASAIEKYGALVCAGLLFFLPRVLRVGYPGGRSPLSFSMALLLGMLCCKYNVFERFHELRIVKQEKLNEGIKFALLAFLVIFGGWYYRELSLKLFWEYHYAVYPFLVILFSVEYLFRVKFLYRMLGFLGKHSLNIWLVHTFVRDYMRPYVWSGRYFLFAPLFILTVSLIVSVCVNLMKKYSGYNAFIGKLQAKIK